MGGSCSTREKREVFVYVIFVGEPERKKPRHRWKDNIKKNLRQI
jgi:hypothetical protein